MTIRVAICDDEPNIRSLLASLVRRQDETCEITEYGDSQTYLSDRQAHDLLFLDIELGGGTAQDSGSGGETGSGAGAGSMNGMELARRLRQMPLSSQPLIIFVTGYDSYVYQAFDVEAFQYLVKPVNQARFAETFRRAAERIAAAEKQRRSTLVIQTGSTSRTVPLQDIYYVESQGHKLLLHLKEGNLEYYGKISQLEQELQGQFSRIHKGYLVNLSYVEEYSRNQVALANGEKLIVSKRKYDDFVKTHLRFLQSQTTLASKSLPVGDSESA
nr:LytTR family DNA-binding domain-containing protein [uncultured Acetatifactor sp.]